VEQPDRVIDLTWWAAAPTILAALVVVVLPGLIALAPIRMGVLARAALAGPASVVSIGVAGIAAPLVGLPFAAWQPFLLAAVVAGAVWVLPRRGLMVPGSAATAPLVVSWLVSAVIIAVVAFASMPTPSLVSQTYDNVFHVAAVADILAHGDASSLTLRTLIETDRAFGVYPAGWHSIVVMVVQATGSTIPVAVNASWIAVCAMVWLPGVAWLTQACLPRVKPSTAALIALPLGTAFGGMPYALLTWGTLYPTFLATAVLPAAVAVPVLTWRSARAARCGHRTRIVLWGAAAMAGAVGAILFAQPRVLASWLVLMAIPGAAVGLQWARNGLRQGGATRRRTAWVLGIAAGAFVCLVAAGVWYAVLRLGFFTRPLDDRLGGPQAAAVQPLWTGAWQVVSQSWLTGVGATVTWPAVLLAGCVLIGLVTAWRGRRTRWIVVAYAVVALLYVFAAGTDDVVTKLATALWYKDKFRLASVLPVLGVPLATLGVATAAGVVRTRLRRRAAIAAAWVVAAASALTLALTGVSASVASIFRMPESGAQHEVVSRTQAGFFAELDEIIPDGQRVLGDPWDGSAWTLAFGSREPVFPHVNGQWDPDRLVLAWNLARIEDDPAVCRALDELKVRHVLYSPHAFGGGDPSGNHFPGPHEAVEIGLFTEVASAGDTRLYRIDQCGPLS
jgi:hypothetical protein